MWNRFRADRDVRGRASPGCCASSIRSASTRSSAEELLALPRRPSRAGGASLRDRADDASASATTARSSSENATSIAAFKHRQQAAFVAERERWAALPPPPEESPDAAPPATEAALPAGAVAVRADVTGSVWQILVKPGDRVAAGDRLVVLETMKMETPLVAPQDGAVRLINVERGGLVTAGQVVMALEPAA